MSFNIFRLSSTYVQNIDATATFHLRSLVSIKAQLHRALRRLCASLMASRLDYFNAVMDGFQNAHYAPLAWPQHGGSPYI